MAPFELRVRLVTRASGAPRSPRAVGWADGGVPVVRSRGSLLGAGAEGAVERGPLEEHDRLGVGDLAGAGHGECAGEGKLYDGDVSPSAATPPPLEAGVS